MRHIGTDTDNDHGWCGERLTNEFHFRNAECAALNGVHGQEANVCPRCIEIISSCLEIIKKQE